MIRKLNKDDVVTYDKSSYGGGSPQDISNCFQTPASTDMVNDNEEMCAADK